MGKISKNEQLKDKKADFGFPKKIIKRTTIKSLIQRSKKEKNNARLFH